MHPGLPTTSIVGSCVAVAAADYCVIAADTRMSTGYNILTRDYSKISKLADQAVMASSGFQADVKALQKLLSAKHLNAVTPLSESEAVDLVKTVFASAAERDIYTGDKLEIAVLNAKGIPNFCTIGKKLNMPVGSVPSGSYVFLAI